MHLINILRLQKASTFSTLVVFALIMLPNIIFAQALDTLQYLETVSITRSNLKREIIPVQTLSGIELEKLSANSVADAIRYFSGAQLKDYGGIGGLKTIDIRSMGSQHVGVFYEGIKIENAQNGLVDLGRFSLDNMEAISLYNGQKSAVLQSAKDYASASSVYLTAKTPQFKNKKYNIKASFKTGSFHLANPTLLWEQKLSKNISSSFNADYLYTSGEYKFRYKVKGKDGEKAYDTTATRKNGDVKYLRLEHALFGKIKDGEWRTRAYYYDSKRGYPGAVVREEAGRFSHEDRQWDRNFFVQGQLKKTISDLYSTQINAKYSHDYLHYQSDTLSPIRVRNTFKLNEIYVSSANAFTILPVWSVNISADFQWDKLDANLAEFIYPSRYSTWLALATSLHLSKIKIQASLLSTFIQDKMEEEKQVQKKWDEYNPSLVISYKPWNKHDFNIRAFYKKVFRMPTFNEIYYAFIGSGKSNLRPEYATQYDLGASYAKQMNSFPMNKIEFQADVYYNNIKDKILATPGGANYRWTMENKGLVKIRGLDLSLITSWDLLKDWNLNTRFSYTYQKAQNYTNSNDKINYKGQLNYIPWHSGSVIIGTTYKTWSLNYSYIYTGKRYTQTANIPANKVLPWYTSDLSINKTFHWKNNKIKLGAEVNNIFNQQYDVIDRYPMPGTNFRIIFRIEI